MANHETDARDAAFVGASAAVVVACVVHHYHGAWDFIIASVVVSFWIVSILMLRQFKNLK